MCGNDDLATLFCWDKAQKTTQTHSFPDKMMNSFKPIDFR